MGRRKSINSEQVLRIIHHWFVHRGMAPTVEELRQSLGAGSTSTVFRCLKQLEDDGFIERWPGARGIKLLKGVEGPVRTRAVPIVGIVPAGPMMLAEENLEGWVRFPESALIPSTSQFFLLRIKGNSMDKAEVQGGRIEDGDLVLVRQQSSANPGDIVVALIDGEATVKRLAKGPNYFILRPESTNKEHQPIVLDRDTMIQGVVCRVLKGGSAIVDDESSEDLEG